MKFFNNCSFFLCKFDYIDLVNLLVFFNYICRSLINGSFTNKTFNIKVKKEVWNQKLIQLNLLNYSKLTCHTVYILQIIPLVCKTVFVFKQKDFLVSCVDCVLVCLLCFFKLYYCSVVLLHLVLLLHRHASFV